MASAAGGGADRVAAETGPLKDWLKDLSAVAGFTVAVGDCATWGGIPATAPNPSDSPGLQFLKRANGGSLGAAYRSKAHGDAGGLQVKIRNARADRVVESLEFFRQQGLEDNHEPQELLLDEDRSLGGFRLLAPGP